MSDRIKTAQKPPPGTRKARRARGRGSFSPCETPLLELLPTEQARQRVARKKAPAEIGSIRKTVSVPAVMSAGTVLVY